MVGSISKPFLNVAASKLARAAELISSVNRRIVFFISENCIPTLI